MTASALSSLSESIYEAGLHPERWPSVLGAISEYVGADSGLMMALAPDLRDPLHVVTWQIDIGLLESAQRYFPTPWMLAAARLPVGQPANMSSIIPREVLEETEFFREIAAPADIPFALGVNTVVDAEVVASVSLYRKESSGDFNDAALERFSELLPVMKTATRVNARIRQLEVLQATALGALDSLSMATFLVNRFGEVRFANREAQRLLDKKDGLRVKDGVLRAGDRVESRALSQLIEESCASGKTPVTPGAVALERPSGRRPFVLLVTAGEEPEMTTVFTSDPDRESSAPAVLLRCAYGLTYAEAEVAAAVATGQGLPGVTEDLGISENTARTHLKRVFHKTQTTRQADLVRLLYENLPQILPN